MRPLVALAVFALAAPARGADLVFPDGKDGARLRVEVTEGVKSPETAWAAFLDEVARDAPSANGAVDVTTRPDDGRAVREHSSGATLHFRDDEWTAFRRGVLAGEFGGGAQER